jgi:hypothetical protein
LTVQNGGHRTVMEIGQTIAGRYRLLARLGPAPTSGPTAPR